MISLFRPHIVEKPQTFTFAFYRSGTATYEFIQGNRPADLLAAAVDHRQCGQAFCRHHFRCSPRRTIRIHIVWRQRVFRSGFQHGRHEFAHDHEFQRIDAVFAAQMVTATTQLFSENGPRHQERCNQVSRDTRNGERQES